jgi:hypothetical protein
VVAGVVADVVTVVVDGEPAAPPVSRPPHPASATTEPRPATAASRAAYPRVIMRRRSAGSPGSPTARPTACPGW